MMRAHLDVGASNLAIRNGSLKGIIERVFAVAKPEAAYFFVESGHRTMLAVLDIADPSLIPQIAEPLFQDLDADVTILPVMISPELEQGLASWVKAA
ncbi:MAG: hypothetical protein D6754_15275 [Alphaproteobacteria bacterium]|nr:MAG: hypothetical protein D6754_15275 [Alphaproteobacteria bacterium]